MRALDHQRMLDTAMAFFLAGERCKPSLSFGRYGEHHVVAPTVVSYSLAVEIALKLLLSIVGVVPPSGRDGHRLRELHSLLPDDSEVHLQWMEDHLDEIDRHFVDWRYPYESDSLSADMDGVRRSFILVHNEIRRLRPDLKSVYERGWGGFSPDWQWAWAERELVETEGRRN